jgi:hypothetical protein
MPKREQILHPATEAGNLMSVVDMLVLETPRQDSELVGYYASKDPEPIVFTKVEYNRSDFGIGPFGAFRATEHAYDRKIRFTTPELAAGELAVIGVSARNQLYFMDEYSNLSTNNQPKRQDREAAMYDRFEKALLGSKDPRVYQAMGNVIIRSQFGPLEPVA